MREYRVIELLPADERTASGNGNGVDMTDTLHVGGREVKAVLTCGAASGTDPTLDVKIQEASKADFSDAVDISGAAFTQLTEDGSEEIHFRFTKPYLRAVSTLGGTTPSFTYAVLLFANHRYTP